MNFIIILLCGIIGPLIVEVYYLKKDIKRLFRDSKDNFTEINHLQYSIEVLKNEIGEKK